MDGLGQSQFPEASPILQTVTCMGVREGTSKLSLTLLECLTTGGMEDRDPSQSPVAILFTPQQWSGQTLFRPLRTHQYCSTGLWLTDGNWAGGCKNHISQNRH